MRHESLARRLARRAFTIPSVVGGFVVSVATLPALLALAAGVDLVRNRRSFSTVRVLLFVVSFLGTETLGLVMLLGVWLTSRGAARLSQTYRVQAIYTRLHFRAVRALFSLRFTCEGQALASEGPVVVLVRHASIIDVLVPGIFIANQYDLRLRYVLKEELLLDPCLDVAGHFLPNHFVRRDRTDTARELEAVKALAQGLTARDGVLIFPEGTRVTARGRERALNGPQRAAALELKHVLPVKPGGAVALLESAPACDVVIVGHTGLEGFARIADIWRGDLVGHTITIKFWREPQSAVPPSREAKLAWLHEQWKRVDRWIDEQQTSREVPS